MNMQNGHTQPTGEALSHQAAVDPLLALVRAFRTEAARINADETANDAHFLRLYDRLMNDTPECRTAEGATEALRLVADDLEHSYDGFHASVLASVQTFLSRRA
jgi:hypothetical protein